MPKTVDTTRTEKTYDLVLTQEDIVEMMNDDDVQLADGNVDEEQTFQIVHKKASGAEVYLKDLAPGDTLVLRFTSVTVQSDEGTFTAVDVLP
jgi:hypothetical protein